jgi:hypothetical protein
VQPTARRIVRAVSGARPELDISHLTPRFVSIATDPPNAQTADLFAAERTAIGAVTQPATWIHPSNQDRARILTAEPIALSVNDGPETMEPVGAGRARGILLHKLMEERRYQSALAELLPAAPDGHRKFLSVGSAPDTGRSIEAPQWARSAKSGDTGTPARFPGSGHLPERVLCS